MNAPIRLDRRLQDWNSLFDGTGRCPEDDIGSFEDEGGASPGDSGRWRALAPPPEATALPPAGRLRGGADPDRVAVSAGITARAVLAYHRDIPELQSDGGSPAAAAANLAEDLARELDGAADHYRRGLFGRALADVRAFVERAT